MVLFAIAVPLLIDADEEREAEIQEARSRTKVGLDLSFARYEQQMSELELTPDQTRDAIALWSLAHEAELETLRAEREQRMLSYRERWKPTPMPVTRPDRAAFSDEEFIVAARRYLGQAEDSLIGLPRTMEEREAARDRLGAWIGQPENVELVDEIQAARRRLYAANPPAPPILLTAEELDALDPEERILEEIFAEQVRVMLREPLADGEEPRDRLGEIDGFVTAKMEELAELRKFRHAQRLADKIARLEQELQNLE